MATLAERLSDIYHNPKLYSTPDQFSPPAERLSHVLRFELMTGCDWHKCTFCNGYQGVPFKVKSFGEYKAHVDEVWEKIGDGKGLRRLFIGGGDALITERSLLTKALRYTARSFYEHTGGFPKRISAYGRTKSILKQGKQGLSRLHHVSQEGGLDLVYWGVESGSDEVLKYVRKGCTLDEMLEAGECLNSAGMQISIMIMPGLGGMKYYQQHVQETAKVIGAIKPKFITFMGVNPAPDSLYAKMMAEEVKDGTNRTLTDIELATQMKEIIAQMPALQTTVGCFPKSVDAVGGNYIHFGSRTIYYSYDKSYLVDDIGGTIKRVLRNREVLENYDNAISDKVQKERKLKWYDYSFLSATGVFLTLGATAAGSCGYKIFTAPMGASAHSIDFSTPGTLALSAFITFGGIILAETLLANKMGNLRREIYDLTELIKEAEYLRSRQ